MLVMVHRNLEALPAHKHWNQFQLKQTNKNQWKDKTLNQQEETKALCKIKLEST